MKDTFDFNYMNGLREDIEDNVKSEEEANDEGETHGNIALKCLMLRQSKMKPASAE